MKFTSGKATGAQVLAAAQPLLDGAAAGQAGKWATLGGDIISSTADANSGDDTKLAKDSANIPSECGSIPSAAKQAGGFVK